MGNKGNSQAKFHIPGVGQQQTCQDLAPISRGGGQAWRSAAAARSECRRRVFSFVVAAVHPCDPGPGVHRESVRYGRRDAQEGGGREERGESRGERREERGERIEEKGEVERGQEERTGREGRRKRIDASNMPLALRQSLRQSFFIEVG